MIPFNQPARVGSELEFVEQVFNGEKMSGDGPFSKRCEEWFEQELGCHRALLTPSCTHALEMAALLLDIRPGDEVIMPSFTFVSTANAFVLRGAKVLFVDIRPDTLNLDEAKVEQAITPKTRAIVAVHYAGVCCHMERLLELASKHQLYLIEDAAQSLGSRYQGRPSGTIGHLAAFSFHETKNYTSGGEGGLLLVNDPSLSERAEILREKGTNRSSFLRGDVAKYTWVDLGSSYLPCELQAAYLWGQLQFFEQVRARRLAIWQAYDQAFRPFSQRWQITLPSIPEQCQHNAHIYHLRVQSKPLRDELIGYLKQRGIAAVFHYVPLHSSPAGLKYGEFFGIDQHTSQVSDTLVRLPLFYNMEQQQIEQVIAQVSAFFETNAQRVAV
ncbi:dTDP-4-amino-4,6-dideoxygalactose transaminase [Agarivorans sp. Alg241-V36]|uniref:dTDP-4-amino-4,6-dideoxygalactose transaminase n=1 Tax=Agarivorans sp. Alg241-V36 TaxID=2305992 RepID=UPI0013D117AA|nr:dTDP-4-amino-4,6-dideoxygalactose transaminase [Agarivorans sp. Alg241-V36]